MSGAKAAGCEPRGMQGGVSMAQATDLSSAACFARTPTHAWWGQRVANPQGCHVLGQGDGCQAFPEGGGHPQLSCPAPCCCPCVQSRLCLDPWCLSGLQVVQGQSSCARGGIEKAQGGESREMGACCGGRETCCLGSRASVVPISGVFGPRTGAGVCPCPCTPEHPKKQSAIRSPRVAPTQAGAPRRH